MSSDYNLNGLMRDLAKQNAEYYQLLNKASGGEYIKQVDYYNSITNNNNNIIGYVPQSCSNANYGSYGGCVIVGNGPSFYTTVRT
jgi:hypothetical protein